jgi:hypothetical protein
MQFAGISYVAILIAAVASFAFGSENKTAMTPLVFVVAALSQLVMAYVLAGVLGHLGPEALTAADGLTTGLIVWAGFVLTSMVVNHGFQGAPRQLTLIDGGHWLGVLAIQGLVIGWYGV